MSDINLYVEVRILKDSKVWKKYTIDNIKTDFSFNEVYDWIKNNFKSKIVGFGDSYQIRDFDHHKLLRPNKWNGDSANVELIAKDIQDDLRYLSTIELSNCALSASWDSFTNLGIVEIFFA